jgi:biopolymer transport protein TolQ
MVSLGAVNFFAGAGVIYAFDHSNPAGKVVLLILLTGSAFSWTVMITKILMVRRQKTQTEHFLKKFHVNRKPLSVFQSRESFPGSAAYQVYKAGCKELLFQMLGSNEIDETLPSRLKDADPISPSAMGAVRAVIERTVGEQALQMEDRMIMLATAVSGGPFLGLLGTVWGVMDTFSDIAAAGSASLTTMAPGVSGALITTVTGLLVAIPAMFGYNFLVVTIRGLTVQLDNFATELVSALEHKYVDPATSDVLR